MGHGLSVFPEQVDDFKTLRSLPPSKIQDAQRYQTLKAKVSLTSEESADLNQLTVELQDYIISEERWNHMSNAIQGNQIFFRDNVQGFITTKQNEMNAHVEVKKDEFISIVEVKKQHVITTMNDSVQQMDNKKNHFLSYVDTKEDEVRTLVQEFDSNTARYYQVWTTADSQYTFNIFNGGQVIGIPNEAKLNIGEENIDLIINGTSLTPYQDFKVMRNGQFDTIELLGDSRNLIANGTEVVAKWFKNVGKLYFKHASSHGEGASDQLTVTEGMLDSIVKTKLNNLNKKMTVSLTSPTSPATYDLWIDVN